ncbi:MAG: hypothetical protein HQK50_00395 [Oligoflexia bacterium]|nr:hypothetical protein [Oligoflexia bacterium]
MKSNFLALMLITSVLSLASFSFIANAEDDNAHHIFNLKTNNLDVFYQNKIHTAVSGQFSYTYMFLPSFGLKTNANYGYYQQHEMPSKDTYYGMALGPSFNFVSKRSDLDKAVFFNLLLGIERETKESSYWHDNDSSSYVYGIVELGKRFHLLKNLSFSPSIEYYHRQETREYPWKRDHFQLKLLSFDLLI